MIRRSCAFLGMLDRLILFTKNVGVALNLIGDYPDGACTKISVVPVARRQAERTGALRPVVAQGSRRAVRPG